MITLSMVFWIFVIFFGVIGAMRGWAKELLVTFSVLVALFIMSILGSFGPLKNVFVKPDSTTSFWIPASILVLLVLAGYQTPMLARFASGKFVREKFSDMLLGFFIGMVNGYLIVGSIWFFMQQAGYPFPSITKPPDPQPFIVNYLPPIWLQGPVLYAAVGLAFVFVLLVFI
jgi:uncharacterized membrane protein required for colicin V production